MDYRYIPFYVQGNAISGLYYGQWEMSEDRDMDYVREMYPMTFSRLQELVEKECNRQEFAGSMMYDEHPDKLGISRIVQNIFSEIKKDEENCVGDECKIVKSRASQRLALLFLLQGIIWKISYDLNHYLSKKHYSFG